MHSSKSLARVRVCGAWLLAFAGGLGWALPVALARDDGDLPAKTPRPQRVVETQPAAVVVDALLRRVSGRLVSASPARAELIVDGERVTVDGPLAVLVNLADNPDRFRESFDAEPGSIEAQEEDGLWTIIDTTDGRRLVAPESRTKWTGQGVRLSASPLAAEELRLEDVRRFRLGRRALALDPSPPAVRAQDTLSLVSGEVLSGFVAGITTPDEGTPEVERGPGGRAVVRVPPSPMVELESGAGGGEKTVTRVSILRVREVLLSNPSVAPGPRAWIDGGAVLAGPATFAEGVWSGPGLNAKAERTPWRSPWVRGVTYAPLRLLAWSGLERVQPLSATPVQVAGASVLWAGESGGASADFGDIELAEPARAEPAGDAARASGARWVLPVNASRVAGTLALCEQCRRWGDCEVSLLIDGAELFRTRLTGASPEHSFNIVVPPQRGQSGGATKPKDQREIEVRVEPGANGPVQDRVLLRSGMVLLGEPGGTASGPAQEPGAGPGSVPGRP